MPAWDKTILQARYMIPEDVLCGRSHDDGTCVPLGRGLQQKPIAVHATNRERSREKTAVGGDLQTCMLTVVGYSSRE